MNAFKTLYHSLLLTGISSIIRFKTRNQSVLLKIKHSIQMVRCTFTMYNLYRIKLLTGLRFGPSHLCKHKYRHNFQDCQDPFATAADILKQKLISPLLKFRK